MASTNVESQKTPQSSLPKKPENWIPGAVLTAIAVAAAYWLLSTNHISAVWPQGYDPLGQWQLSALVAALPVIVLLGIWPSRTSRRIMQHSPVWSPRC